MPLCSSHLETPDKPLVFMHWGKAGGGSVVTFLEEATRALAVSYVTLHGHGGGFHWNLTWNQTWTTGLAGTASTGMWVAGSNEAGMVSRYYTSAANTVFAWRRDASKLTLISQFPGSRLVAWLRDPVSRYISAWRASARSKEAQGGANHTGAELGDKLHADATTWPNHNNHTRADVAFYLIGADPLHAATNLHCTPGKDPQGEDGRKARCLANLVRSEPTSGWPTSMGGATWTELLSQKPGWPQPSERAGAIGRFERAWIAASRQLYFVGRTESMTEDWAALLTKMGLPRASWPKLSHEHSHPSYNVEATPWMVAVLRTVYARDLVLTLWFEEDLGLVPTGYHANITAEGNCYMI